MNYKSYQDSLKQNEPPAGLDPILLGLWYDAKGNWDKAHDLIDGTPAHGADWAHAYLHRKEGDQWNADYWYRRAGKSKPEITLEKEWEEIVIYLCSTL